MQSITTIKTKSQESLARLTDSIQQQPPAVQLWGVAGAAAVVGGVVLAASAKGILAIAGTLASPPIALTVGAIGGGVMGWTFMQKRTASATAQPVPTAPVLTGLAESTAAG